MNQPNGNIWLNRCLINGPYLTLVLNEQDYLAVMAHCNVKRPPAWINKGADATLHRLEKEGKLLCVVSLDTSSKPSPEQIIGLLVHEAVHVWQEFCLSIGETNPSQEFEAYSIQAITHELIYGYNEAKHKEKNHGSKRPKTSKSRK